MKHSIQRRGFIPLIFVLILATSQIACGGGFASQLRLILSASGPLLDSLVASGVINQSQRAGLFTDFSDLASGAVTLGDDLKACASDKSCKLNAVDRFQVKFWDVERRGHFKLSPKLQNVQTILAGIISAARIYYGGTPSGVAAPGEVPVVTEVDLKARLNDLKKAMRP